MATEQAPDREIKSFGSAIFEHGLAGILGTRRIKPARRGQKRGNHNLIKAYAEYHQPF